MASTLPGIHDCPAPSSSCFLAAAVLPFTPKTPSETLCFGRTKFLTKFAPNLLENITRPENKIWGFAMNFWARELFSFNQR